MEEVGEMVEEVQQDSEEEEDPMDAVKVNRRVRFVGTPVYGIVEIERIQALADGIADHARRCTAGNVLITNITTQIDAKVKVECSACCMPIFPQSRTEATPRSEWHGIAEYRGTRDGLVKELHVRMSTVCLCNPGTEITAINCFLSGVGCGEMASKFTRDKTVKRVVAAVNKVDEEINSELMPELRKNPVITNGGTDGASSACSRNQAAHVATTIKGREGEILISKTLYRGLTGHSGSLETLALDEGMYELK